MTHRVTGLIASTSALRMFSSTHSLRQPITLVGDLAILPLLDAELEPFGPAILLGHEEWACSLIGQDAGHGFRLLSEALLDDLRRASHSGPLTYFETDYWGGTGGQGAVVFQDGEVAFGPRWKIDNHWAEETYWDADIRPINHALNLLGVRIEPPHDDEFDTVGLYRHRRTEGWINGDPY